MWLYWLATALIATASAVLWAAARQRTIDGSRPTLPGGHWLWGHARFFAPIETLHERLIGLARDGPRAVWLRIGPAGPLGTDLLVINDVALATALLRMDASRAEQDPAAVDDIARVIGAGLISARGSVWSRRRAVVSGHFLSPSALRDYAPGMAADAARMAAKLAAQVATEAIAGHASSHDMMTDWLMPYVLGISLRLTCGDLPADLDLRAFMRDLDTVFGEFDARAFKPCNALRPTTAAHKAALARVRRIICAVVAQTRARMANADDGDSAGSDDSRGNRPTLAAILLDEGADVYETDDAVRDETLLVTFGAYETTAATAAYTLHLLAAHPDVQARVRDEVRAATRTTAGMLGPGAATPLLDACVSESMRLYPAAFAVSRRAETDLRVEAPPTADDPVACVVDVPAGTRVLINGVGIARSPRHWTDPDAFRPERWLADECSRGDARALRASLPFGTGPRACPGRKLALLEVRTAIAALVDAVEFAPDPTRPFTCAVGFVLRPDGPHLVCTPAATGADATRV
ncbi:Cytochrome P450 [Pandoravirus salinus]|uniref:Cytochrome P450 n=1 Tax=Pandoravirus salinus TaxID=1349410 RepID=S4VXU7_9VIRU|nr:Cytochrome P450 [Pandoravirus salinus]AGO84286.1 Cytochrome P450 [Pandoravirus salinus]